MPLPSYLQSGEYHSESDEDFTVRKATPKKAAPKRSAKSQSKKTKGGKKRKKAATPSSSEEDDDVPMKTQEVLSTDSEDGWCQFEVPAELVARRKAAEAFWRFGPNGPRKTTRMNLRNKSGIPVADTKTVEQEEMYNRTAAANKNDRSSDDIRIQMEEELKQQEKREAQLAAARAAAAQELAKIQAEPKPKPKPKAQPLTWLPDGSTEKKETVLDSSREAWSDFKKSNAEVDKELDESRKAFGYIDKQEFLARADQKQWEQGWAIRNKEREARHLKAMREGKN